VGGGRGTDAALLLDLGEDLGSESEFDETRWTSS